ncbi:MAG: DUF4416 family protein [Candidatus Omnitrophica bacterium]|nr:DUF4416 family protein [Candidatus Omnitrophota bacterium]
MIHQQNMSVFKRNFKTINNQIISKPIIGFISGNEKLIDIVVGKMEKKFGKTDCSTGFMPFLYTDYYKEEFGDDLKKKIFSFEKLITLENSHKIKHFTCSIEKKYSDHGKRTINIDPGYINYAKLVLFTTKDYNHRIYLGQGIFAEVTLNYSNKKKTFLPNDWTYPDYRTDEYISFFNKARRIFAEQIANRNQ